LSGILLVLAGCVTSAGGGTPASETVRVTGAGGAMTAEIHPTDLLRGGDVAVPLDQTWAVMPAVYDSLGLPVGSLDASTHTIDSPTVRVRRQLKGTALSKYLNCGNTQGGRSADSYEIRLSVRTTLTSTGDGTTVMTNVAAEGRPITISAEYTRCTSTGHLETRVVELTNQLAR
jgi:hypothetical protein